MKIFITGGAGYVGSALVKKLSDADMASAITVYDNFSGGNSLFFHQKLKNVTFIKGDILDNRTLKKSMAGHDVVIHLAEAKNTNHPHYLEQVNHWGTAEVCYAIEALGIKNIIHLSTTKVYPYTSGDETIVDSFTENPADAYGSSKLRGEEHIKRFITKPDFSTHIVRSASIYGYSPSLKLDSFLNKIVADAHYFNRIQLFGTGFQQRSFVHIDHVVDAIIGLMTQKVPSQIHNLSEHIASPIDLIDVLKELYPEMEFIFTSHHLTVPHIRVKTSSQLLPLLTNNKGILEHLQSLKEQFSIQ